MRTMSKPQLSQSTIASFVHRVTPPSVPEVGEGLMYALGSHDNSGIRVLSPRRDPRNRRDTIMLCAFW